MTAPTKPDTSPQNVARVLRELIPDINDCGDEKCDHFDCRKLREYREMADTLEYQARKYRELLRAFPEYAPTESESDD